MHGAHRASGFRPSRDEAEERLPYSPRAGAVLAARGAVLAARGAVTGRAAAAAPVGVGVLRLRLDVRLAARLRLSCARTAGKPSGQGFEGCPADCGWMSASRRACASAARAQQKTLRAGF